MAASYYPISTLRTGHRKLARRVKSLKFQVLGPFENAAMDMRSAFAYRRCYMRLRPQHSKRDPAQVAKALLRLSVIALTISSISSPQANASGLEHWVCTDTRFTPPLPPLTTKWTIVENRMFVANGKGSLKVVSNSPTMIVAYLVFQELNKPNKPFVSWVYIIDKIGKRFVSYYDIVTSAVSMAGDHDEAEPTIRTGPCIQSISN
jgi:hypothetical protein